MKIPPRLLTQNAFRCPRCGKVYRRIQPRKQTKESFLKKKVWKLPVWAIALIALLLIGAIAGTDRPASEPVSQVTPTQAVSTQVTPVQITTEAPVLAPFILSSSDLGAYGRYITLNANTEQEYSYIGHYIPAGRYKVTNNDSAAVQITFYSDGITINSGIEEPNPGTQNPVVLMPNSEAEVLIQENDYVKLSDNTENTYWEPIL